MEGRGIPAQGISSGRSTGAHFKEGQQGLQVLQVSTAVLHV